MSADRTTSVGPPGVPSEFGPSPIDRSGGGAHRRQFVLGPTPVSVDEDWTSVVVGEGLHLSYHRALPVVPAHDRDGGVWHLLGIAVQTDPARAAPTEEIAESPGSRVDALPSAWAGRWVLVGDAGLRGDAAGLLGCFYARAPTGDIVVSSSPALLREHVGAEGESPPPRYGFGMDWYPPPATRFPNLRRLLPSQTLDLSDRNRPVRHRRLLPEQRIETYDETLAYLETSVGTALRNLAARRQPLWLGLTGGHDSRVLLAAMVRERIDFTSFTWDVFGLSRTDRVLPPLLARDAGIEHRSIERRRFDEERLRTLDEHTALHTVDLDRELYTWGQYATFPDGAILILTTLFEIGAAYYYRKLSARPEDVVQEVERAFGFAEHHATSAAHRDGLREWAEWIAAHPELAMDWRDRFYWEQRGAGWAASFLQGSDLMAVDSVSPVNCDSILAAMLRIEPARRRAKRWEVDLAYRLAPSVTDHPYALGGPWITRLRRGVLGWTHHPSKRRFATGRTRSLAYRMRVLRLPVPSRPSDVGSR